MELEDNFHRLTVVVQQLLVSLELEDPSSPVKRFLKRLITKSNETTAEPSVFRLIKSEYVCQTWKEYYI
jgi:hypothetical protein